MGASSSVWKEARDFAERHLESKHQSLRIPSAYRIEPSIKRTQSDPRSSLWIPSAHQAKPLMKRTQSDPLPLRLSSTYAKSRAGPSSLNLHGRKSSLEEVKFSDSKGTKQTSVSTPLSPAVEFDDLSKLSKKAVRLGSVGSGKHRVSLDSLRMREFFSSSKSSPRLTLLRRY